MTPVMFSTDGTRIFTFAFNLSKPGPSRMVVYDARPVNQGLTKAEDR
jgi:hypothetical protein